MKVTILFVGAIVALATVINFIKSLPFRFIDFDSFQYLAFSRFIFGKGELFIDPIRSPFTAFFLVPDLMAARALMGIFHIGITLVLFFLAFHLFKDKIIAAFSALLYGLCWWMLIFQTSPLTDLPGMFFFFLGLLFWWNPARSKMKWAGLCFGIAFLFRFDIVLFLIPLFLFTSRSHWLSLLVPFLSVAILLEAILGLIFYPGLSYAPLEFVRYNLSAVGTRQGFEAWNLTGQMIKLFPVLCFLAVFSFVFFKRREVKVLLAILVFIWLAVSFIHPPPYEPRIYVVKLLPFLALLSGYALILACRFIKSDKLLFWGKAAGFAAVLIISLAQIASITYPQRNFPEEYCQAGSAPFCSNFHSAVEFHCNKKTQLVELSLNTLEQDILRCNVFFDFKDAARHNPEAEKELYKRGFFIAGNETVSVFRLSP